MEVFDERRYKILFGMALDKCVSKFGASVHTPEADEYVAAAWQNFLTSGLPMPDVAWVKAIPSVVTEWLDQYLENNFVSFGGIPKWRNEPTWRFEGEAPMRFVGSIEYPIGYGVGSRDISDSRSIFLFEGETKDGNGVIRLVYKLVAQESGSPGSAYYPDVN